MGDAKNCIQLNRYLLTWFIITAFHSLAAQCHLNWESILFCAPEFSQLATNPKKYRLKIICTEVVRSPDGGTHFFTSHFNPYDSTYYYPASIVKLPASIFACEKITALSPYGVDLDTRLIIDSNYICQTPLYFDYYTNDSTASISEFIEKALVVSDNVAYSRLYEFVGAEYFVKRFNEMNMDGAAIRHRFSNCDDSANRHTNPFHFINNLGDTLYTQPGSHFAGQYPTLGPSSLVGKAQKINGKWVKEPKSFKNSNALPLDYIHAMIMELIYPESQLFDYSISEAQRKYLRAMLTISPIMSKNNKIATNKDFHSNYTNYLFFGQDPSPRENNIELCNIVGLAYGFMTDVCYVKDPEKGTEFFLSASLYLNESNSFGTGNYEYEKIGFPFLKCLGWKIKSELEND